MKADGSFKENGFLSTGIGYHPFVQLYEWMDFFQIRDVAVNISRNELGIINITATNQENHNND